MPWRRLERKTRPATPDVQGLHFFFLFFSLGGRRGRTRDQPILRGRCVRVSHQPALGWLAMAKAWMSKPCASQTTRGWQQRWTPQMNNQCRNSGQARLETSDPRGATSARKQTPPPVFRTIPTTRLPSAFLVAGPGATAVSGIDLRPCLELWTRQLTCTHLRQATRKKEACARGPRRVSGQP